MWVISDMSIVLERRSFSLSSDRVVISVWTYDLGVDNGREQSDSAVFGGGERLRQRLYDSILLVLLLKLMFVLC